MLVDEPVHVAISTSQRFECLNVLLDILKSNFKKKFITHVFCNLCREDLKVHEDKIDKRLVDFFYHYPDDCKMINDPYKDKSTKIKHKRIQPLKLIKFVFETMGNMDDIKKFVYTECDVFPLDERKYLEPYFSIFDPKEIIASHNDLACIKTPSGMICPSPLFLTKVASQKIAKKIQIHEQDNQASFEGCLMSAIKDADVNLKQLSENLPNNFFAAKNLDIITETTHQHNIFNLEKSLKKRKINKGTWINEIFEKDEIVELTSGKVMRKDKEFTLEYWMR